MKIGILNNKKSYLSEILAYKEYLLKKKFKLKISNNIKNLVSCNYIIMFSGFFLFKPKCKAKFIHDYASLSTPPFSIIKDFIKFKLNFKPDFRIFNSSFIKNHFNFRDNVPYLIRKAGVDKELFSKKKFKIKKNNTIVYVGSIESRSGLEKCILKLSQLNKKIILAGYVSTNFKNKFKKYKNIKFTGKLNRQRIKKILRECSYGLNYIPNKFPWYNQFSLKLLEYCANNLKIITNNYKHVSNFEKKNSARFFYIENINKNLIDTFNFRTPSVKTYEWQYLLKKIKFEKIFK